MNLSRAEYDRQTDADAGHINLGTGVDVSIAELTRVDRRGGGLYRQHPLRPGTARRRTAQAARQSRVPQPRLDTRRCRWPKGSPHLRRLPGAEQAHDRPCLSVALITGITGQDGSYLAEFLLAKGYDRPRHQAPRQPVQHRSASTTSTRIRTSTTALRAALRRPVRHQQPDPHRPADPAGRDLQPGRAKPRGGELRVPEYTADVDAIGTLRLLEAIRILGLEKKTRFYQASTSELYGLVQETPQKETTPFYPRSPYAVAKLYAYWITVNYREAYGMYACNGILFNHESPRRGETFVTRKITRGLANIAQGLDQCLYMGNMTRCATGATPRTTCACSG
jgi:hypothetical protein